MSWNDARTFSIQGRRDAAVQIAGTNVSLSWVESKLLEHNNVEQASARTFTSASGDLRVKTFIVLKNDHEQARHDFSFWLHETLPAAARPRSVRFGAALPTNAMGKPSDWPIDEAVSATPAPASN